MARFFHAIAIPAITASAIVLAWEAASRLGWIAPFIMPAPTEIVSEIARAWRDLIYHAYVTSVEVVLGFLLATVAGVGLALLMVYVRAFERAVYPWIVVSQVIPKVALGPLFVIWLGFGLLPKVTIAFLIAFFPILVDALIGLKSVDQEPLFLLRSMGARRLRTFWYLQLPHALPNIFGGMRVAMTLATVGAIIGEFIGANEGLGYLLLFANGTINTRLLFAALFAVSILALLLYVALLALEKVFIPWHVSARMEAVRATM